MPEVWRSNDTGIETNNEISCILFTGAGAEACFFFKRKKLDYIAMDIKAPFDKYKDICGSEEYLDRINQSIDLLMQGGVDYEFRTKFTPRLSEEDIRTIAYRIKGAKLYVLQQFRNVDENGKWCCEYGKEKPYGSEYIKKVIDDDKIAEEFKSRVLEDKGFEVTDKPMKIYGYCSRCRKQLF